MVALPESVAPSAQSTASGLRGQPQLPKLDGPTSATQQLALLMSQCASGDAEAFADLYDRTSGRLYGLALRVLRSADHAAEVLQEVYVEVWQKAGSFDPRRGTVLAWMVTMTHRRAVDRVRSVTRAAGRDQAWASGTRIVDRDLVWEAVENELDVARVRRALEELTRIQREALSLAYFGGRTHIDIAALLDIPLATVKTRIRDGLIKLRVHCGAGRDHT